jgi:hypothetical protein
LGSSKPTQRTTPLAAQREAKSWPGGDGGGLASPVVDPESDVAPWASVSPPVPASAEGGGVPEGAADGLEPEEHAAIIPRTPMTNEMRRV